MSNMAQASTMSASTTVSQIVNSSYKPVPNPLQFLSTSSNEEDVVSSPNSTTIPTTTTPIAATNVPRTTTTTTSVETLATTKPTAKAPTTTTTTTKTTKINEIILSLKEPQYKDLLWTKFNTLGKTRNHTLEEQTGLEIYNHFMNNNNNGSNGSSVVTTTKFYRLNRKEEKLLLSNDEALERITRDLKRRLETIHNWYGKSAKDSPPPSNNNLFVSKRKYSDGVPAEQTKSKSSMPKNIMKDIAPSAGWKMDTVQTATSSSTTTNNTNNNNEQQQQRKSPREQPKQKPNYYSAVLKHNPLPELNASINANQNQLLPTSNDIILSLYDEKYRNVIFSSFLELAKDESKKKEFAIQIYNNFKSMNANCKFYKVERGGKAYVVVDDALALQKISGDIGRRSETIKRWNVDVSEARQAESTFNQWQQASTTLPPGTNFARRSAFPSRPKQRPTRELANLQDCHEEEKKQEDYTGTSQFLLEGVSSSDTYESLESLFHTVKRSSANIILSLNDDYYKEIMWRHYRVLGKVRDSVKEAELASRLFGLFKKEMGSAGRFFKQDHGVDVEVSEKLAADKIVADIRRRMKNYRKWSGVPEKQAERQPRRVRKPASSTRIGLPPSSSTPSRTQHGRQAKVPVVYTDTQPTLNQYTTASEALSPRRSSRKPSPNEDSTYMSMSNNQDVLLSLMDANYKNILYKHYNILGKKQPNDKTNREATHANQIFQSLRRSLGRNGRFFKKTSHGDLRFEVDDAGAMQKITRDLKRRNESIHKWLGVSTTSSSNGSKSSTTIGTLQKQQAPFEQYEYEQSDYMMEEEELLPITQEHAWRGQLAPSPIDNTADSRAFYGDKQQYSFKPNKVQTNKMLVDQLIASHLGQRLPPLKNIVTSKSIQTPNQLISMLQLATHKVNELNGTHTKHCRVLRLYNLSELNSFDQNIVMAAPRLSELADFMNTTRKSLKKWFAMYLNGVIGGFDYDRFGDDRINNHQKIFFGIEHSTSYHITKGGEKMMEAFFQHVEKKVFQDAEISRKNPNIDEDDDYNLFAATPGDVSDPWNNEPSNILVGAATSSSSSSYNQGPYSDHRCTQVPTTKTHVFYSDDEDKSPFQRNFERNQARLDALDTGLELDREAKRVKRGVKDRMLCMIKGCEKHAQTRSDGCCNAHFSMIGKGKIPKGKKGGKKAYVPNSLANHVDMQYSNHDNTVTLGKRSVDDVYAQAVILKDPSVRDKVQAGSRVYVEYDGDNMLYKATVRKVFVDKDVQMVKIHYDGKKRHILDNIPLDMVNSLIVGENQSADPPQTQTGLEAQQQQVQTENQTADPPPQVEALGLEVQQQQQIESDDGNIFTKLPKLYPAVVPSGKKEVEYSCPELGPGWTIRIAARKVAQRDGPRIDRFFLAPSGKKMRSANEVERYHKQNPVEFDIQSSSAGSLKVEKPQVEQCQEVSSSINDLSSQVESNTTSTVTVTCVNDDGMTAFPTEFSPIHAEKELKVNETRLLAISPITTGPPGENQQAKYAGVSKDMNAFNEKKASVASPVSLQHSRSPGSPDLPKSGPRSPKEILARSNSAFSSTPPRLVRPTLHHQLYQTSSSKAHFPAMRGANLSQLQENNGFNRRLKGKITSAVQNERRPKRKRQPITRFEKQEDLQISPYSRKPKFQADVQINEYKRRPKIPGAVSKSALCHCSDCDKGGYTVQGIYAHYGRAHTGSLSWKGVTYSCPFCPSKGAPRIFRSFYELDAHVIASHPKCEVEGPNPSKLAGLPGRVRNKKFKASSNDMYQGGISAQILSPLRERRASSLAMKYYDDSPEEDEESEEEEEQGPPRWDAIEFANLLPDGRKEYSSDLHKVIEIIGQQCQVQEQAVEEAREQRIKLCKEESDKEARELEEERLLYQRGIRERARFAEAERMEKHRYTAKAEEQALRMQYESRNKRKNQEEVQLAKLCSQPIIFSSGSQRQNAKQGATCTDEQCQLCKNKFIPLLLLDNEVKKVNLNDPAVDVSDLFIQSTKVLMPNIRIIDDSFFMEAEPDGVAEDTAEDNTKDDGKKANQSRRDASTAKKVRKEEDKLMMLKNTQYSLEFIKKYNSGLIKNSWGDIKKDSRVPKAKRKYISTGRPVGRPKLSTL